MTIINYQDYDGLGLAELVAQKEITPLELLDSAIELTERYNPQINAVVTKMYDLARQAAIQEIPQGPFAGVPFLIKDLGILYQGVPTTNGCRFYQNFVPDHDSEVVKRFKKAGLIIFGKTNTPEFGLSYCTESLLFGPCRNPWDLNLTPGGSSGGAAAAVATRIVPIAHGGDGGGSIRVPASCCGLFGLKPTRARVPVGPDVGEAWSGLVATHAISVSVRDSAAMLDAISGPELGDPYFAPYQATSFLSETTSPPKKLKIAFTNFAPQIICDSEVNQALQHTLKICEALGHTIEEAKPSYQEEVMQQAMHVIIAGNIKMFLNFWSMLSGKTISPNELEPVTWHTAQVAETLTAVDYARAILTIHSQSRLIAQFFTKYDVLITPTLAKIPSSIGALTCKSGNIEEFFYNSHIFSPFASLYNMTGQPAMSVPLFWTEKNVPVGTQFVGRFGEEATLFNLAAQLEKAQPWITRKPGLLLQECNKDCNLA